MSVTTIYPSSDDTIYVGDATFATARGAASGTARGNTINVVQCVLSGIYYIERGFFSLDTSGIADGDTISSAVFSIFAKNHIGTDGGRSYNIYNSTHSDTVVGADFDLAGSTAYCDTAITQASLTASYVEKSYTLNATGIAGITKTGITKISIREVAKDVGNSAPADEVSMIFEQVETAGTTDDPKLVVTHAAVSSSVKDIIGQGIIAAPR